MRDHLFGALGLDPNKVLEWFGSWAVWGLFLIVFAESGIMIGFFLPGDSLLFVAGFLSSVGEQADKVAVMPNIIFVSLGCFIAAVAGDQVGYMFGHRVGPALFKRPDSRLFKQKYLQKSEEFFEIHGSKTIILARFVPVVRTFAPIVAGAGKMRYRTFLSYNIIGGFVWAVGLTQLGYWLGQKFPSLGESIDKVVIVIVVVSLLPMGFEVLRHRRKAAKQAAAGDAPASVSASASASAVDPASIDITKVD
jgi:membrane-associated protein